jgi:hypothetical protein
LPPALADGKRSKTFSIAPALAGGKKVKHFQLPPALAGGKKEQNIFNCPQLWLVEKRSKTALWLKPIGLKIIFIHQLKRVAIKSSEIF